MSFVSQKHPTLVLQKTPSGLLEGIKQAGVQRQASKQFRPTLAPGKSAGNLGSLPDEVQEVLGELPMAPTSLAAILALSPPESTPSDAMEQRSMLVQLIGAAAKAAAHGEPELALRGYCAAFAVSRNAPLLLLAANMLFKMGQVAA